MIVDSLCCVTGHTSLVPPPWRRQDDLNSLCIKDSEYCSAGVGKVNHICTAWESMYRNAKSLFACVSSD